MHIICKLSLLLKAYILLSIMRDIVYHIRTIYCIYHYGFFITYKYNIGIGGGEGGIREKIIIQNSLSILA